MYVHAAGISWEFCRLLLVLVCCCIVLCCHSSCDCLPVPRVYLESLIQFVCGVTDNRRTVSTVCIVGAMASGDSWYEADRSGVNFWVRIQVPSLVTLDSPGVVVLDTSYVADFLGLRTRDADAELVLPGRAQDSVRVLIPERQRGGQRLP